MEEELRLQVRGARILYGTMAVGLAFVTGIMYLLGKDGDVPRDEQLELILVLIVFVLPAVEIPFYLLIRAGARSQARKMVRKDASREENARAVLVQIRGLQIVSAALVEGCGLFGAVVYFITGREIVLIVPVAALMLLIAMFPTTEKVETAIRHLLEEGDGVAGAGNGE